VSQHPDDAELLALAAARKDEPAFAAEREHVARCTPCRVRLEESEALVVLLDRAHAEVTVSPALRARVHARVLPLRRPHDPRWAALAIMAAVLGSFWLAYLDGRGSDLRWNDLVPDLGVRCLAFQGAFAGIPVVVGMALSRAGKLRLDPLAFSAWTMGFALLGQLALRGHCGAYNLSVHLFAFHFVGVLLAGVLGSGIGRWLHAPR
jgi:hypothetical protein